MLDAIKSFFSNEIEPGAHGGDDSSAPMSVEVAACALMLEIAHADDEFSESERTHIEGVLRRHFALQDDKIDELLRLSEKERKASVDLFQFTRLIAESYDLGQKMVLAEALWGLVYADGEVEKHETFLMRKLSPLLGLEAGYLSEARKRAEKKR
jgi:uncharacterized tellurite resistance protein B-like protein